MLVAGAIEQQGIADVVKRRAVFSGRQRAAGGAGHLMKCHWISFRAGVTRTLCRPARKLGYSRGASPQTCQRQQQWHKRCSDFKEMAGHTTRQGSLVWFMSREPFGGGSVGC